MRRGRCRTGAGAVRPVGMSCSFRAVGTLARQTSWIAVLTAMGLALGFLNMSVLYPRYLQSAEFGLTRLVVSIAIVAAQVAHLGLESTVIRYFPYFRDRERRHKGLFRVVLVIGGLGAVVAMLVLLLFHDRFAVWFNDKSGLYGSYGLVVLPLLLAEVFFLLLRGFSRAVHRSIAPVLLREFILRLLQTVLIVLHACFALPFHVFLGAFTGTFVITAVALVVDLWRSGEFGFGRVRVRVPRRMSRSMARYSVITLSVGVAGVAAGNVDQMMIAAMLPEGLEHVAHYAVAMFLASVIMVPSRAMVQPALPLLAEAWRRRDTPHIGALNRNSTTVLITIGLYVALCLLLAKDAIYAVMPEEYAGGRRSLMILCGANLVNLAGGLGGSIISTSRRYAFDASSGLLYLGLNVVLDYVFIRWWGMDGAAWSSLVTMLVVVAWRAAFLWTRFRLWAYDARAFGKLALATAVCAGVWLIPSAGNIWADAGLRCAVVTLVYWTLVFRTQVSPDLRAQFRKIVAVVRRR